MSVLVVPKSPQHNGWKKARSEGPRPGRARRSPKMVSRQRRRAGTATPGPSQAQKEGKEDGRGWWNKTQGKQDTPLICASAEAPQLRRRCWPPRSERGGHDGRCRSRCSCGQLAKAQQLLLGVLTWGPAHAGAVGVRCCNAGRLRRVLPPSRWRAAGMALHSSTRLLSGSKQLAPG